MAEPDRLAVTREAAEAAFDLKAEELVALDVREVSSFADTFLLLTGRSDRQVRSICDAIEQRLRARGERPIGIEGYSDGRWVLMDFADLIVHVFIPDVRTHYDLERLWSDAPRLDLGVDVPPEPVRGAP